MNFQELERYLSTGLFEQYKLCYIDDVSKTVWDYTPDAKVYRETEEWKAEDRRREAKFKREGRMSSDDPEFSIFTNPILRRGSQCQDYPNPDYIPGQQTLSAYFTPIALDEQWGDEDLLQSCGQRWQGTARVCPETPCNCAGRDSDLHSGAPCW